MSTRHTDAVSAAFVALIVWVAGRRRGLAPSELLHPIPFVGGAVSSILIEIVFARWPDRAARLWKQPGVRVAAPLGLVAATIYAGNRCNSTVPFAATLGGLAGYFGMLIGITSNVIPEPVQWFR